MKRLICSGLIIVLIFMFSISFSDPIVEPIPLLDDTKTEDIKENLIDLSQEEKKILEELFLLLQEVKEMEQIELSTSIQIDDLKVEINDMEALIKLETDKYDDNLHIMEEFLKSYQKNGATTYLNLVLSSNNLETLLRRINSLRDISRNITTLLEDLEDRRDKLVRDKGLLSETLTLFEARQNELHVALIKKNMLKENLEDRLSALQEDKAKYEEYLSKLDNSWTSIKPIFSETISILVTMIEQGNLPEETIDINFTLNGVTGIIKEDILRNILAIQPFPTTVDLVFSDDMLELIMPEINIYMSGNLEVLDKQTLIFNMIEGQYLGMKLERSAMDELFSVGYLEFNFKSLLGKSTIKSIKINDDNLELFINPVLF